jgi:hypothetical protein
LSLKIASEENKNALKRFAIVALMGGLYIKTTIKPL